MIAPPVVKDIPEAKTKTASKCCMKSLRILLVMNELPLPFGHACGRWYYVLLKGLVERGHSVIAFAPSDSSREIAMAHELFPSATYDLRTFQYPLRRGLQAKWETLKRPFSYMISPEMIGEFEAECGKGYDVLHLEGIWSGWIGQNQNLSRALLNFHNLYDIDLEKQQPDWSSLVGRRLLRRAERHLLRSYPTLLTLSSRLKEAVHVIAPQATAHVVPLGLETDLYPFISAESRPSEPVISVIGSMGWYPSHSAAVRLLTRLWPAIKERVPHARVQIVGWNALSALKDYLNLPGVQIVENVPDTQLYFDSASVMLYAPESGSGMKVKILEAFAFGVPVVTTGEGVEGIPAEDGVHAGICDDDAGLIERAIKLLQDVGQQERQRTAARDLLEKHCGSQATLDGIEKTYTEVLRAP